MITFLKNTFLYSGKYKSHPEAVIISCFFNPQNSPYRLRAFNKWYGDIKHLNHRIIECVIGDAKPQLQENENITRVYTENLLWHKEALLNKIVSELPEKYKYVFWVDADVIFTNLNWLTDSVEQLQENNIVQPFDWCVHLDKDQVEPEFDLAFNKGMYDAKGSLVQRSKRIWKSFASNWVENRADACSENYDVHGHVGFAWGARREVLDRVPLYDKALIGGGDHIIAHAAVGQIPHKCITKSFTEDIEPVNAWSKMFYQVTGGKLSYVQGDLYHLWHGDIDKRDYLKRIIDFTPKTKQINQKDKNGLYITHKGDDEYMKRYFRQREVSDDNSFMNSMMLGYMTDSTLLGGALGGNYMGAMVGDMLNNSDEKKTEFGGGEFGGGGAGSIYNESSSVNDTQPTQQGDSNNYDSLATANAINHSLANDSVPDTTPDMNNTDDGTGSGNFS